MPQLSFPFALGRAGAQRASFIGCGVNYDSVRQPARVILRQVFRDWLSFAGHEEQTMAVLVDLHVITSTNPSAVASFLDRVWREAARTKRPPQCVEISRKTIHYGICDFDIRMSGSAGFRGIQSDPFFNPADTLRRRRFGHNSCLLRWMYERSDRMHGISDIRSRVRET